jgi:hypothetical protein
MMGLDTNVCVTHTVYVLHMESIAARLPTQVVDMGTHGRLVPKC